MSGTIANDGYRYNTSVMRRVAEEGQRQGVTKDEILKSAKLLEDGNRYLNAAELRRGLDAVAKGASHENLLGMDTRSFEAAAKADIARGASSPIPMLTALAFDGTQPTAVVGPDAAIRDERMDRVAHAVVDRLKGLSRHWKAKVVGAEAGTDVLGGQLPRAYPAPNSATYGEVYNVLELRIPRVGDETLALVYKRELNQWDDGEYIEDEPTLMLAFVDDDTRTLFGSGYHLEGGLDDGWRREDGLLPTPPGLFTETDPRRVDDMVAALADKVVARLLQYQALNG